jgi:hypothetical protein
MPVSRLYATGFAAGGFRSPRSTTLDQDERGNAERRHDVEGRPDAGSLLAFHLGVAVRP